MNISRRGFLTGAASLGGFTLASGCSTIPFFAPKKAKVALQLYSIGGYIGKVGLPKALEEVAKIGYKGVEFAGYWGFKPAELKKMLDDNGLQACGTHCHKNDFSPQNYAKKCEFELGYGNKFICSPGGGNMPPGGVSAPSQAKDDFVKRLCDYYNEAAVNCAKYGCKVGLHNHMWEFQIKMLDGTTFWDRFLSNTSKDVLFEQDVGWTTCAGYDPCEQYKKYPGRSFTLHAKENGMGKGVKKFDAILGQPGQPGAVPVAWDALFPVTDADGVEWYVVECERHQGSLDAVRPSFEFLRSKGRA